MFTSAPPLIARLFVHDEDGAEGNLLDPIQEPDGHGIDSVVQALQMKGKQHYAFFPSGTNDEIEINLLPRGQRVVARDLPEIGCVRSGQ